jgi:DNA-binding NtrC family response regulator
MSLSNIILIAEDDELQQNFIAIFIQTHFPDYEPVIAKDGTEAMKAIEADIKDHIALVILDLGLPKMSGEDILEKTIKLKPHLPVIIHTAAKKMDTAVNLMQSGATDYITKPVSKERFIVSIRNALKMASIEKENTLLRSRVSGSLSFRDIIGESDAIKDVISMAQKASRSDIPVLLNGETGTGKEVFAQAIHKESSRKDKPFIAVNCGAIPEHLIESILFGHEKGAFTGAIKDSIGKFREADGGTLFLDEIGDLPLDAQVKLLRVLQLSEVNPVGSGGSIPVDVRVISATHKNLTKAVFENRFREDLLYRVNVLPITIPPLRERKEDIEALTRHFIKRFSLERDIPIKDIDKNAISSLKKSNWPGNIRQLENIIYRAVVMSEGTVISIEDIAEGLSTAEDKANAADLNTLNEASANTANITLYDKNQALKTMEDIEYEAIVHAYNHFDGNVSKAARALNIGRSTFYRKMIPRDNGD